MSRRLFPTLIAVGLAASAFADDEVSKAQWSVHAECEMIAPPQKLALPLIADLNDDAKAEAAWASAQQMSARGEATLAAHLDLEGAAGENHHRKARDGRKDCG